MSPRTGPLPHRPRASQRSQPQRGALSWALSWAPGAGPPPRTPPPSRHRPRKRAPPRDRPRGAQKRRAWGAAEEPEGFRAGGDLERQTRRDCGGTGRRTGRGRVCPPRSARSSASRSGVTLSHGSAPSAPGSGAAQSGLRPGTASGPRLRVPCRRCAQGGRRGRGPRSCGWQRGIRLLGPARKPVPVPFGRTAPRRRTTAPNNCSRGQGDQGAQSPGVQNPGSRPASVSPSFPFCLQALCLPPATRSPASTPARCWLGLVICQEASDLLPVPLSRPVTESDRPLRRVGARSATAKEPPGEQNQVQLGKQQNKKPPRRLKK